jgi:hypothetical protein
VKSFVTGKSPRGWRRGATQLGFLDIVTAIVVLAILVYAASWQFSSYRTAPSGGSGPTQAH